MSEELGRASDKLLAKTSVLSHTYGVLTYGREGSYQGSEIINSEIDALEKEYVSVYHQLTTKSNRLLYLSRLQELESVSDQMIQDRYDEIRQKHSSVASDDLENFLQVQIQTVKTDAILNGLMQKALPVLRAVHQANKDLNSSEMNLLTNLENLYSSKGLTYELMKGLDAEEDLRSQYVKNNVKITDLIKHSLNPELRTLQKLNEKLMKRSYALVEQKTERIGSEMENIPSKEKKQLERSYRELVSKWDFLSKLCEFLPSFVTSIPINWYSDKDLFGIIQDCGKVSERLERLQQIVNTRTIGDFSVQELLMLDFEEVEQD